MPTIPERRLFNSQNPHGKAGQVVASIYNCNGEEAETGSLNKVQ